MSSFPRPASNGVRALVFDVFGTVVDWRSGVIYHGQTLGQRLGLSLDWAALADDWRAGYPLAMAQVQRGEVPWATIDVLHRRILDRLLAERGVALAEADAAELNLAWHRLPAWPDTVPGLRRLKTHFTIASLSNGNVSLLVDMAKNAGLPWDTVLSAELFGHYKPAPEAYLGAARLLNVAPAELLMVAAHPSDLRAAAACGLRTAYVQRPLERGPNGPQEAWQVGEFDWVVSDFNALAQVLGA